MSGYEANLDRLLTRQATVPGVLTPDSAFHYDTVRASVGFLEGPGEWHLNDVNLFLWDADAEGDLLPQVGSLTLTEASMVTITAEGGYTITATLLTYDSARAGFTFQPLPNKVRLELDAAPALPDGESFVITLPDGGQAGDITIDQSVWCARRDFTGRDLVGTIGGGQVTITDSRIIVRYDDKDRWDVGDTFTLEEVNYTIRGIARVGGRRQYLELLSRNLG